MKASPILLLTIAAAASGATPKLNVLMIVVDDLPPAIGAYGDPQVKTPNIDSLAARGLLFERAYCQVALCSPSRISVLSGRRPSTSGIYTIGPTLRSMMPNVTTLPQHLKNQGYFTRSLGKVYHRGVHDPEIGDPASWSVSTWKSAQPRNGADGLRLIAARREDYARRKIPPPPTGESSIVMAAPVFEAPEVSDDDLWDGDTAREAVAALREFTRQPDRQFFLAVGFLNPHVPWVAPKRYWDLYDPAKLIMAGNPFPPRNAPPFAATSGNDFYQYSNVPRSRKIDEAFGRQCLHGYLAAISYVDAQVGRILSALDETALARNTLVMLWGDNGYYMGEHGWWGGKHNNYEGATRVPLICAVPGQPHPGARTGALVELVDIYPSIVELCGLPPPADAAQLEGVSFALLFDNPNRQWKKAAFSEYRKSGAVANGARATYHGLAMRTERYRYVEWTNPARGQRVARELYDHRSDPQENDNIADRADPALIEGLARRIQGHWRAAGP